MKGDDDDDDDDDVDDADDADDDDDFIYYRRSICAHLIKV